MLGALIMVVAAARAAAHALGVLPADDGEGDGATEGARANEGGFAHGRIRLAVMSDLSELRRLERELVKVEVGYWTARAGRSRPAALPPAIPVAHAHASDSPGKRTDAITSVGFCVVHACCTPPCASPFDLSFCSALWIR